MRAVRQIVPTATEPVAPPEGRVSKTEIVCLLLLPLLELLQVPPEKSHESATRLSIKLF